MLVPELLLETLEELQNEEFRTLKWYLSQNILESCKPFPKSHLQNASRTDTVDKIIDSYREELAVNITVEILRKMRNNRAAEELKSRYAGGKTAPSTSSSSAGATPAAPLAMTAREGSVIIAPTVVGGTSGSWNITINK